VDVALVAPFLSSAAFVAGRARSPCLAPVPRRLHGARTAVIAGSVRRAPTNLIPRKARRAPTNLILRRARSARLEGWRRPHPSRRRLRRLLRMRYWQPGQVLVVHSSLSGWSKSPSGLSRSRWTAGVRKSFSIRSASSNRSSMRKRISGANFRLTRRPISPRR